MVVVTGVAVFCLEAALIERFFTGRSVGLYSMAINDPRLRNFQRWANRSAIA